MTVYRQKFRDKDGIERKSEFYHYRFMVNGRNHNGVCVACTNEADAKNYEKKLKNEALKLSQQKSVKALIENYREELTGGTNILLNDAYELALKKPRKRQASKKLQNAKKRYWEDFLSFIHTEYPELKKLSSIQQSHAEAYISQLRAKGRFKKEIIFTRKNKKFSYNTIERLSPRTCNVYQQSIAEVFSKLSGEAGILQNPFAGIEKQDNEYESREAFTEKELLQIRDNANEFILALFSIGIATALREGDICTLRWAEVDFKNDIITRKMQKTKRSVEIPIMPPLREFLLKLKAKAGESEYVLPEHAAIYMANPSGISSRVKSFLEKQGIQTNKNIEGRDRAVSIKDVHSLRHSFCYYAGIYGIPLLIVQSIVGHMTPEMTKHYQAHATREVKREKLLQMPDFMGVSSKDGIDIVLEKSPEFYRAQLQQRISMADIKKLKTILDKWDSF